MAQSLAELLEALHRDPTNYGTLMQLGALLAEGGNVPAARTVFTQAIHAHPNAAAPYACLGTLLADDGEHAPAREMFDAALAREPAYREALRGVAVIHEREGELAQAQAVWRHGFANGSLEVAPYRGNASAVRVLYVTSALGGNIPMQYVLDDGTFEVTTLIAESVPPDVRLPEHDVLFNAIGDADRCARALEFAERICARTHARVINRPQSLFATTRLRNAERFRTLAGVSAARMELVHSADLTPQNGAARLASAGFDWPILLRSPGFQTGEHFVRVDAPDELARAVAELPAGPLLAIEYADTRGGDAMFRKYRIMTIGGRLYPVHLALSDTWKVHYFHSSMAESSAYRDEEAVFLADMRAALGARTMDAIERIAAMLDVDYGGIDFTILASGDVFVFEANATMVLVPPPAGPQWIYRRAAFADAIGSARALVVAAGCA